MLQVVLCVEPTLPSGVTVIGLSVKHPSFPVGDGVCDKMPLDDWLS